MQNSTLPFKNDWIGTVRSTEPRMIYGNSYDLEGYPSLYQQIVAFAIKHNLNPKDIQDDLIRLNGIELFKAEEYFKQTFYPNTLQD